jgi:ABC-type Zn uptake system ZnuABC Zn-binding protein ZnuA
VLQRNSRNPAVLAGQLGHLDASRAVRALGVPTAGTDRSAGDLHVAGNPHYLLDPLCGLQVAALLRDRFAALWPAQEVAFARGFTTLRERLAEAMVGAELARRYDQDAEQLALAFGNGALLPMLEQQGDRARLGGWFAALAPLRGSKVVVDHDLWPYFAERFGLVVSGFLEPKPGVSPSTAHLARLAERMRLDGARAVLTTPYFPAQHAQSLRAAVGAAVAPMAHQPGAHPGTDDYVAFVDHNVKTLVATLAAAGTTGQ